MSLEQKITKKYNKLLSESKNIADKIKAWKLLNNCEEVLSNVKKLYEDLCKFASRFDKNITINAKLLTGELSDDIYKDIEENFVKRIAEEKYNFVYVGKEEEKDLNKVKDRINKEYPDIIKQFSAKYDKLKTDFKNSKNLIGFFHENTFHTTPEHDQMIEHDICGWGKYITIKIDEFIGHTLEFMAEELQNKEKLLLAEDEKYFYDENDSTYLSKGLRYLFPNWWSYRRQYFSKHTIETVADDIKIFPTGEPLQNEVRQWGFGDCYLKSALIALAKNNKKAIKDCFVDGPDKVENEENITIRFFYKNKEASKHEKIDTIKISVNRKKLIIPQSIKNGALWPKIIEKAYVVYRSEGYEDYYSKRTSLNGGTSDKVLFAITGKISRLSDERENEKFTPENVIDTIRRKLEKGRTLTCNFKTNFKTKDVKSKEEVQILANHAYAVVGINDAKKYVRLIEPNKELGRSIENSPKSKEGGHIAMPSKDFRNHFGRIAYTTGK